MLTQGHGQFTTQSSNAAFQQLASSLPQDPNPVYQVFVKHINGQTYTLDVTRITTLQAIKEQLEQISSLPLPSNADFVFAGSRHELEKTVEQISLSKEAKLYIVIKQ